ncbi:C-terminal domain of CinA type S [Lutibaculum baratangense AMV1]|uniref:C-terminal domain of CinA type S n=2 Tax=Lutibaculum TaxID=1358438 RepID=V4TNA8_9HYPH|nr:CinA family protein [Lutibaculum baratangense]ESR27208.1 C-terminal domain of CinA type S [Lutibaculum baratangense AMV1]
MMLLDLLQRHELRLGTAESCTGGLISAYLTEAPGSSGAFEVGYVTYSNEAKQRLLGVSPDLLERHGAVSEPVARAMAEGALACGAIDIAVSVTGVAGPAGGSEEKPVGTVHFGVAGLNRRTRHRRESFGDLGRRGIRMESVRTAFAMVRDFVENPD